MKNVKVTKVNGISVKEAKAINSLINGSKAVIIGSALVNTGIVGAAAIGGKAGLVKVDSPEAEKLAKVMTVSIWTQVGAGAGYLLGKGLATISNVKSKKAVKKMAKEYKEVAEAADDVLDDIDDILDLDIESEDGEAKETSEA